MSTEFKFYTKIRLSQVEKQTNLKIIKKDDNLFLQDPDGNSLLVRTGAWLIENSNESDHDTFELVRYGSNDPSNILDELVEKFELKFLTDDDEEYLHYNKDEDFDTYLDECMKSYGY